MDKATQRGYLDESFRMFHIRDRRKQNFEYHFHAFDKVVIFLDGCVTYYVEDKAYNLRPWDVLLVAHDQVHRPVIEPEEIYDRVIFYIDPGYLGEKCDLDAMFRRAVEMQYNIIRPNVQERIMLTDMFTSLEKEQAAPDFAGEMLKSALMTLIMVRLNRISLRSVPENERVYSSDPTISEIVRYIQENISEDMTIDVLAERFYVSESFLMHRFREVTGYSPHNYIIIKRLACASELISGGMSAAEAARACGYGNYSSFSRAYRKQYGVSPTQPLSCMLGTEPPMD